MSENTDKFSFQHLRYFWTVAREGSLTRAAQALSLSQSTLSIQVHALEESLGCKLLERAGRELVPTETGRRVAQYAEQVFQIGQDILKVAQGADVAVPLTFSVGVGDLIPKLAVLEIVEPLLRESVHLTFRNERSGTILAELERGTIDIAITDSPLGVGAPSTAFEQLAFVAQVHLFAVEPLWAKYRKGFPRSLDGAPFFLPLEGTAQRRSLNQWFQSHGIRPRVLAEFDDAALLKTFGAAGLAVFPATDFVAKELMQQHKLRMFEETPELQESFYVILSEKAQACPFLRKTVLESLKTHTPTKEA